MGMALPATDIRVCPALEQIQRGHLMLVLHSQEQRKVEHIQTAVEVRDTPETKVDILGGVNRRGVGVGAGVEEELDSAQVALLCGVHEADAFVVFEVVFDEMRGDDLVPAAVEDGHHEEGARGGRGLCDLQDELGWEVCEAHCGGLRVT